MEKFIDILAIVLPALLIIFALIKYFIPGFNKYAAGGVIKTPPGAKLLNFLSAIFLIILLLAGIANYLFFQSKSPGGSGSKPIPLAVSKHSSTFNESVTKVLDAYYNVSDGLVKWDTTLVAKYSHELKTALDNFKIEELKADTTGIYESALDPLANAKSQNEIILNSPDLNAKRVAFHSLSENLRLLLIIVKYDAGKIYWQECPMAFGDDVPGNWLSKTTEVRNPYLGLKHPKYKDGMLECGGPKDTINFMIQNNVTVNNSDLTESKDTVGKP